MRSRDFLQRAAALALVLSASRAAGLLAQSSLLVDIRDLTPREHRSEGFVLSSPQTLRIEAVGA